MSAHGTEVSFRLGPGTLDEARDIARRLAAAAHGCRRHVLFVDAEAGEYGCLAEWDSREDAVGFTRRPATAEEITVLGARLGKEPRIRVYSMEETA
ncbi:MAG: hypothetical protein JHC74_06420 [Thermoleophilia bacterium]|nr:hypothetical protein [Thermoleophilia bacterium]